MEFYISKNGQQSGPFAESTVVQMLNSGEILPSDYAIRKGETDWKQLSTLFPATATANSTVTAAVKKTSAGRKIFGGLIFAGAVLGLGIGLFVFALASAGTQDPCEQAKKSFAEMDTLRKELDAFSEEDAVKRPTIYKSKYDAYESKRGWVKTWGNQCDNRSKYKLIAYGLFGFSCFFLMVGGFLVFKK